MFGNKKTKKKKQRGATAVELAIILPVMLLFIFGIIEFSLLLYNKNIINHAAREGARIGVAYNPYRVDDTDIKDAVNEYIASKLISFSNNEAIINDNNDITICPNTSGSGNKLIVPVEYSYTFLFLPVVSIPVGTEVEMICE